MTPIGLPTDDTVAVPLALDGSSGTRLGVAEAEVAGYFPLVSVVIPAFNAARFICTTLDAVLRQTYRHIEVIVIDDGSTDATTDLVRQYAQRDHRVHLHLQSNRGPSEARNTGIAKSSGEFIAPLDADDIWYPEKLRKQVECMLR